jgi:hypothetical protein
MPLLRAVLLVAGGAAAAVVSAADIPARNCTNPVFVDGYLGAPKMPMVVGRPKPHPTTKALADGLPCAAYNGAAESCCTLETLTTIADMFAEGDAILEEAAAAIEDNNYAWELATQMTDDMGALCDFLGLFPLFGFARPCAAAEEVVEEYALKMSTAVEDVVATEIECVQALRSYFKGALCFACDVDWADHLVYDADGNLAGLEVHKNTCDRIVDKCAPVNDAVIGVANLATEFVEEMVSTLRHVVVAPPAC